jgi:hypothetical protein
VLLLRGHSRGAIFRNDDKPCDARHGACALAGNWQSASRNVALISSRPLTALQVFTCSAPRASFYFVKLLVGKFCRGAGMQPLSRGNRPDRRRLSTRPRNQKVYPSGGPRRHIAMAPIIGNDA